MEDEKVVFSSLIFIYFFLTASLIVYVCCKNMRSKNLVLLIFSLFFYSWGGPKYIVLLVMMTFINWIISLYIEKNKGKTESRAAVVSAAIISLGLLCIFKYTGFIITNINYITGSDRIIPEIVLPIGISFYTFQLLSYTVDVYRGDVEAQKSFWKLLLYSSLFHQCIAGPIVRYKDVAYEIENRTVNSYEIEKGIMRFTIGLAKKVILANSCAQIADSLLGTAQSNFSEMSAVGLAVGALAYMLQIYLDFSAYSDMAIGMGLMIGFHYKENFDYPYTSRSASEFWRRWHISLGACFRDYVYITLGGNRKGKLRTLINLFVVWFLTGLWHGASWNFVLWGLYYFIFIAVEKLFLLKFMDNLPRIISHIYLLIVVYFGWILFKFSDINTLFLNIKGIFLLNGNPAVNFEARTMILNNIYILIVSIIAVTPAFKNIVHFIKSYKLCGRLVNLCETLYAPILLILSTMMLVGNSYNPFLYFQF